LGYYKFVIIKTGIWALYLGKIKYIMTNLISFLDCKRKFPIYQKIDNTTRERLIELVYLKDRSVREACRELDLNFSTAKTILRTFKLEKRIAKKEVVHAKNKIFKISKIQRSTVSSCPKNLSNIKIAKFFEDNEIKLFDTAVDKMTELIFLFKQILQLLLIEVEINKNTIDYFMYFQKLYKNKIVT
jgi:transposase-like protein